MPIPAMRTSDAGLAEIAGSEGIILSPYYDSAGVLTWGIGHTAAAGGIDPATLPMGVEQPLERVLSTFRDDMERVEARVNQAVTVPLRQHEFDALVSFDFNTGGIYRATLTRKLNAGDRAGAAAAFDGWHKPPEIIGRRNNEKRLFAEGRYAHGGLANASPADAKGTVNYRAGRQVDALAILRSAKPPEPVQPGHDAPAPETAGDASSGSSASPAPAVITGGGLIAGGAIAGSSGGNGAALWIGAAIFIAALVVGAIAIFRSRKE